MELIVGPWLNSQRTYERLVFVGRYGSDAQIGLLLTLIVSQIAGKEKRVCWEIITIHID